MLLFFSYVEFNSFLPVCFGLPSRITVCDGKEEVGQNSGTPDRVKGLKDKVKVGISQLKSVPDDHHMAHCTQVPQLLLKVKQAAPGELLRAEARALNHFHLLTTTSTNLHLQRLESTKGD